MTDILLVRHGHVPGILPQRFRGRAELELTERGRREAMLTADWLSHHYRPMAIYTSPLKRCVDTGQVIASRCGVSANISPALNDIDYGEWQGLTHDEVTANWPERWSRWRTAPHLMRFPSGESFTELIDRAAEVLTFALDLHRDQVVIMVGHDSINRAILLLALNQSLSSYWQLTLEPCSISAVTIKDDGCTVTLLNQTSHLKL